MGSVDDMIAVIWKKVEKDHAKAKMQFLVDQFEKHRDKEVYDREYEPEKTKKGYDAVGRYQDWKMVRKKFFLMSTSQFYISEEEHLSVRSDRWNINCA